MVIALHRSPPPPPQRRFPAPNIYSAVPVLSIIFIYTERKQTSADL